MRWKTFVLGMITLQAGCAAVGVTSTSDPAKKLDDAMSLLNVGDRPLPAERLIIEARDIYTGRGDRLGLANAYRTYALFLRSKPVTEYEDFYIENGFMDKSMTFNTRYDGAIDYLKRAQAIYLAEGKDDMLSNVYFHLGMVSKLNNDLPGACAYLDQSAKAASAFAATHPGEHIDLPPGYSSFQEAIDASRKGIGCK